MADSTFGGRRLEQLLWAGSDPVSKTVLVRTQSAAGKVFEMPIAASIATTLAVALITQAGALGDVGSAQAIEVTGASVALSANGTAALVISLVGGAELYCALDAKTAGELAANLAQVSTALKAGPGGKQ